MNGVSEHIENINEFAASEVATAIRQPDAEAFGSLDYSAALDRVLAVREALNEVFIDKEEAVDLMLACTIAGVPMVLLGPPGTAKSALVRSFCSLMGLRLDRKNIGEFTDQVQQALRDTKDKDLLKQIKVVDRPLFEYLVTRYTTPEEILGPTNIEAMLSLSLFFRESAGMLPGAEIAFLDEIFKANSAILNALLSIINERIYYNAGHAFDVNLVTVFGASNEAPDGLELAALYDRFPIRVVSDPVPDEKIEELLRSSEEIAHGQGVKRGAGQSKSTDRVTCVNDFRLLSRVMQVKFGRAGNIFGEELGSREEGQFRENFVHLFRTLRQEFGISDRTPERLLQVAKALAILDEKSELSSEYLKVFRYCAPTAETARVLAEIVDETIAGLED